MKKISIILFLLFVFISCEKKEEKFSDEMIDKLSVIDDEIPSRYMFTNLYVLISENTILETNNNELYHIYKLNYNKKFKRFNDFLEEVLNKDLIIGFDSFNQKKYFRGFSLNPKIEKEYLDLGFEKFLKKYSKKTISNYNDFELNKDLISKEEYLSIVYFLYINKYDVSTDCYIGKDYIIKREKSFK